MTSASQTFWDRNAARYARSPIDDPSAYEAKLARVRAVLHTGDRLLEIGCGTGSTALRLAPVVADVTAADGSPRMIDIARKKLSGSAPRNIRFLQADAEDRIEGAPFDAVCAFSLLHLVDDPARVVASVRAQLKPSGLFISKTVCLGDAPLPLRLMVRALTALRIAPRVIPLRRADLVRCLKDAGFRIEEIQDFSKRRISPFIIARCPAN